MAEHVQSKGGVARGASTISQGIEMALNSGNTVVCFGSLYLAGTVRTCFMDTYKRFLRGRCKSFRDALSEEERIEKSKEICGKIVSLPEYENGKNISWLCFCQRYAIII